MVGAPHTGGIRGNFLQGDATLMFDMVRQSVGAEFAGIKALDLNVVHSTSRAFHDQGRV